MSHRNPDEVHGIDGPDYVTLVIEWDALADDRGQIRTAFSNDRLHLTGDGYRIWADALRPHLPLR